MVRTQGRTRYPTAATVWNSNSRMETDVYMFALKANLFCILSFFLQRFELTLPGLKNFG